MSEVLSAKERVERLENLVAEYGARIAALEAKLAAIGAVFTGNAEDVADDFELDGKYGNEPIRKDPSAKFWTGAPHVGRRFSECDPAYLDAFAKWKSVCARMKRKEAASATTPRKREDSEKFAGFDERDAARARGWAKRLRAGWAAPEKPGLVRGSSTLAVPAGGTLLRQPSTLLRSTKEQPPASQTETLSRDAAQQAIAADLDFPNRSGMSDAAEPEDLPEEPVQLEDDDLPIAGGM